VVSFIFVNVKFSLIGRNWDLGWIRGFWFLQITSLVSNDFRCALNFVVLIEQMKIICIEQRINIVIEWLLFNANSAFFQLYHDENKLIVNEMMMRSTLY
jgi:hypothetical protein